MNKDFKISLIALCAIAAVSFPAISGTGDDAVDEEQLYYQNVIKSRETGVYEHDGLLYVHVREEFDVRKCSRKQKRSQVIFKAQDLLKQWAIDFSAAERSQNDRCPDGVKFAKEIIALYLPGWQFREWNPSFSMREFPHDSGNGLYILGQSVTKKDVIDCIPKSFFRPFAERDWEIALPKAIAAGIEDNGRNAVLTRCLAWDASKHYITPDRVENKEYSKVQRLVCDYLKQSDFAKEIRAAKTRIIGPFSFINWQKESGDVESHSNVTCEVVTNYMANAAVCTNCVKRIQTADEIARTGRSSGTQVTSVERVANAAEIVVQKTVTITEETRIVLKRLDCSVEGCPVFERCFLSGGTNAVFESAPSKLGKNAASVYFAKGPVEEKRWVLMDALRENPGDKALWNYLGKCLVNCGDTLGGIVCFRAALRVDPDYEFALVNLAESYQTLKLTKLAMGLAAYARAKATDPWCVRHADGLLKAE